ncbi:hypothetical protein FIBSPDRAFT_887228 [Athelia psychrophila]|uniref:Uncharacterized protein n=1 Tax=Athelia psychrophila TaxID=1759441 RepID=A0A166PSM6_9AGAM|nr:hypothetical protein FIBSPDRAFT_902325 [Fibularhizoctonia sp. CBS 109695]KZP26405.1 hypothetical protein FIBSPDRAFT_887204 [Fibularhizoctonia sp. CBS 109695]KZP26431.1 hypothetical protein FIBSPDRAFT_887228 [Fibularhizoctonia sp. CBS 109695]
MKSIRISKRQPDDPQITSHLVLSRYHNLALWRLTVTVNVFPPGSFQSALMSAHEQVLPLYDKLSPPLFKAAVVEGGAKWCCTTNSVQTKITLDAISKTVSGFPFSYPPTRDPNWESREGMDLRLSSKRSATPRKIRPYLPHPKADVRRRTPGYASVGNYVIIELHKGGRRLELQRAMFAPPCSHCMGAAVL